MLPYFFNKKLKKSIPLWVVKNGNLTKWLESKSKSFEVWLKSNNFKQKAGNYIILPKPSGEIAGVLAIVPKKVSIQVFLIKNL